MLHVGVSGSLLASWLPLIAALVPFAVAGCGSKAIEGFPSDGGAVAVDGGCAGPVSLDLAIGRAPGTDGELAAGPVVAGDTASAVYFRGWTDAGQQALRGYNPRTGAALTIERLHADDTPIDARGDAFLVYRADSPGSSGGLYYVDARAERRLDSGRSYAWQFGDWDGRPRRMVEPGRAAWRHAEGNADAVWYFDGTSTRALSDGLNGNAEPYLDGETVVWTALVGNRATLFVWSAGQRSAVSDTRFAASPVVSAGRIFWLADGALVTRLVTGGAVEVLAQGPCGPAATEGGRAVFSCQPSDGGVDPGTPVLGQRVHYYDGARTTVIPSLGGALHVPRLSGRRVAWIEYSGPGALCMPGGSGTVAAWSGDPASAPQRVAQVGTPCFCCNAIWPTPRLVFTGDVLAWNYATDAPDGGSISRGGSVGWAVLGDVCR